MVMQVGYKQRFFFRAFSWIFHVILPVPGNLCIWETQLVDETQQDPKRVMSSEQMSSFLKTFSALRHSPGTTKTKLRGDFAFKAQ